MLVGQTMFSVRHGTEHRAEHALQELTELLRASAGHTGHRILRSFGMSPLGSALCDEGREATLGEVHFILESEWVSLDDHDSFYQSPPVQHLYGSLHSILASGPFEILYDVVVEEPQRDGAAV